MKYLHYFRFSARTAHRHGALRELQAHITPEGFLLVESTLQIVKDGPNVAAVG